ncbi:MAG TPA: hypothetical protein DDW52_26250, partial [Planctomycetaceae bacterium]|nr:hypothetical protein [Planctomycetaceae bacterium]
MRKPISRSALAAVPTPTTGANAQRLMFDSGF